MAIAFTTAGPIPPPLGLLRPRQGSLAGGIPAAPDAAPDGFALTIGLDGLRFAFFCG